VESPGLTEDQLKLLRPLSETHPDIEKAYQEGGLRRRGPQKAPTKILVSIRYSEEVLEYFRSTGPQWQTRMDEALQEWIQAHPGATGGTAGLR
jgi:uncharacterized protein (DUF4415 family)